MGATHNAIMGDCPAPLHAHGFLLAESAAPHARQMALRRFAHVSLRGSEVYHLDSLGALEPWLVFWCRAGHGARGLEFRLRWPKCGGLNTVNTNDLHDRRTKTLYWKSQRNTARLNWKASGIPLDLTATEALLRLFETESGPLTVCVRESAGE